MIDRNGVRLHSGMLSGFKSEYLSGLRRNLHLALAGGRSRAADIGSAGHAVGGDRLAPSRLVLATVSCGVMAV
ncbi:hypothetical protein [Microvirga arabica]|uniref:hypothetical protein n=1 Tax=Microvirga arabica TaxID=1128671 RepID=UPI0036127842